MFIEAIFAIGILTMSFTSTADLSATEKTKDIYQEWLKRPLIAGASISADYGGASPGKRLALRFTEAANIKTIAFSGKPGRETLKSVTSKALADRSIVIAVDLFFWDSAMPDVQPSLNALDELLTNVKKVDGAIVLGDIPELLPGRQIQRQKLNAAIYKACRAYPKCFVMPLTGLLAQVLSTGGLTIDGRHRGLHELIPDGLHLSELAGNYLANVLADLLSGKLPRTP